MAFTLGNLVLPGYPNQVGEKLQVVFDHTGPLSYVRYVSATKVGGDVIKATGGGLNLGGFDNVDDTADTTGQINAIVTMDLAGSGNAVPQITLRYFSLVTATLGGQSQTLGNEIVAATNLSTFSFRLYAIMV
jgi:hypothetical protein